MRKANQLRGAAFFEDIRIILSRDEEDVRSRYDHLYVLFMEVLNELTADSALTFSGPYAKLDHVCRVVNESASGIRRLNAFRCRAAHSDTGEEEELSRQWPYDVKTVCLFVAKVEEMAVPDDLRRLFPASYPPEAYGGRTTDCIRAVVTDIGEELLTVQPIEGDPRRIQVALSEEGAPFGDFIYLKAILSPGDRVNIVRPVLRDGIHYPQLMIYQPDYLVDISSIAACYASYGTTPYAYLLNMLSPSANSEALLLGNFASQLLDEAVHQTGHPLTYAESVRDFFRSNAVKLATCRDMDPESFHANAKRQKLILQKMVEVAFPQIPGYDERKVLLEPSFFCEMLGIQGRMDLLQEDMKVLIEQKSGKMYYKGGHEEKHYVQVLLYRALLHYSYHIPNGEINSFLLYSKYENGLMAEGPAPKLLAEAMCIRNQVVKLMMRLAAGEGRALLSTLKPEQLRKGEVTDHFWVTYVLPKLKPFLTPLGQASPLLSDYFYRMLGFVAREHVLAKMGTPAKEASGLAALWNATAEEKHAAGNMLDGLRITRLLDGDGGGIERVVLAMDECEDNLPNFRVGDIVVLYPHAQGHQPDATKTMVIRCTIVELMPDRVMLQLRAPQKNTSVFRQDESGVRWAIEHDMMESSFTSLYRSVASVLSANPDRQSLLLGQRQPVVDPTKVPVRQYGGFEEMMRHFVRAQDLFILIGPPGTGKTSFGLVNMLLEELAAGGTVLLLSYTNRAVNEICSKLCEHDIDFIRLGSGASCPSEYHDHLVGERAEKLGKMSMVADMLATARVVVATTTSMLSNTDLFGLRDFSLAIIDEASQILEPHLLGILCAKYQGMNAIKRFAMIGDHKQLPAVVQQPEAASVVREESLRGIGLTDCRLSLFERLLRWCGWQSECVFMFSKQGRMHHEVALFPNEAFYQGRLEEVPLIHQMGPMAFANVESGNTLQQMLSLHRLLFAAVWPERMSGYGKTNEAEAVCITRVIREVYHLYVVNGRPFDAKATIGVIVPYRHQIAAVQKQLRTLGIPVLMDIDIDTVERFQGSQRDVIIYGFTIQRMAQLDFLTANIFEEEGKAIDRKLNVALTRAREQMVVVGNPDLLERVSVFNDLMMFIRSHGCYWVCK